MSRTPLSLRLALAILLLIPAVSAQTLKVINADSQSTTFSAEQLAAMPHVTLEARDHDTPAQFQGIPLATILEKAGVKFDAKQHVPPVSEVLVVEAADGYKAAYAIGEIDPSIASTQIILADKHDGKAIDDKQGPLRVIVPTDKRGARWVRQATTLRVVSVK